MAMAKALTCTPLKKLFKFIFSIVILSYYLIFLTHSSKYNYVEPQTQIQNLQVEPIAQKLESIRIQYTEEPILQQTLPEPARHSLKTKDKYSRRIKRVKTVDKQVPKEFQLETALWRPLNPKDPELPLDLDEFYEDRSIAQAEWMKAMAQSEIFKELKPKRIIVEDNFVQAYDGHPLKCPGLEAWESKCTIELDNGTNGATVFPSNINDYDAHFGFRFWFPQFERKLPENSKVKQFLLTYEPPPLTGKIDVSLNNAFLVTYWRGADIPIPYVPKYRLHGMWNESLNEGMKNYAEGKTKLAAIVVSDCTPHNNRLGYVKELQRYIPVDIYGKCGTLNCTEPCFENLGKEYKFYLSFENSNCRDYITEKFGSNALYHNMVPIVLGAEKRDYLFVAPANSFIHVEDYDSPAELATFVKKIDRNDTLYNTYFHWKNQGYYQTYALDAMCRVCALLFMADYIQPPTWPQNTTWESASVCLPDGRWYWHRPNNHLNSSV